MYTSHKTQKPSCVLFADFWNEPDVDCVGFDSLRIANGHILITVFGVIGLHKFQFCVITIFNQIVY